MEGGMNMSDGDILYSVEGKVAVITLNRPDSLNAFTSKMHEDLPKIIDEADHDDAVRSIVVTGAGRCFCAGNDLKDTFLSEEYAGKGEAGKLPSDSFSASISYPVDTDYSK